MKYKTIIFFIVIIGLLCGCIGNSNTFVDSFQSNIISYELSYVKADNTPIMLINYRNATNPTWSELINFLQEDNTDSYVYNNDTFVCGDFAELLHNNAETQGIRAGVVFVDFSNPGPYPYYTTIPYEMAMMPELADHYYRGDCYWSNEDWVSLLNEEKENIISEFNTEVEYDHMINVFNTTDKGLVFVDSTGINQVEKDEGEWQQCIDAIAYISKGYRYGLISIDESESPKYDYFKEYEERLVDYLARSNRYDFYSIKYDRCMDKWDEKGYLYGTDDDYDNIVMFEEILWEHLDKEWISLNSSSLSEEYYEPAGEVIDIEILW